MLGKWLRQAILKNEGKRNPLGDPPLRLAGQGVSDKLDEESLAMVLAAVLPVVIPLLSVGVFVVSIKARGWPDGMELLQGFLLWLFAIVLFGYVAWRKREQVRNLRLGMLAERMVGQQLERCRTHGYFVFHDIECQGKTKSFNIDHLAIGPGGIFVVETKARSKPETGETKAWVQGNSVQFSDGSYDPDAIPQAEAIAHHVRELLGGLIADSPHLCRAFTPSRPLPVQAVLVYPGWYIDRSKGNWHEVLLTNHGGAVGFIRKSKPKLSDQEARRIGMVLGKHLQQERRELVKH